MKIDQERIKSLNLHRSLAKTVPDPDFLRYGSLQGLPLLSDNPPRVEPLPSPQSLSILIPLAPLNRRSQGIGKIAYV